MCPLTSFFIHLSFHATPLLSFTTNSYVCRHRYILHKSNCAALHHYLHKTHTLIVALHSYILKFLLHPEFPSSICSVYDRQDPILNCSFWAKCDSYSERTSSHSGNCVIRVENMPWLGRDQGHEELVAMVSGETSSESLSVKS